MFSGCDCNLNPIKVIKVAAKKGKVHKCSACRSVRSIGSIVWRFLLGGDAVTSVLTTSLYQQLTSELKIEQKEVNENNVGWDLKPMKLKPGNFSKFYYTALENMEQYYFLIIFLQKILSLNPVIENIILKNNLQNIIFIAGSLPEREY
ncbi:hypothetical protein [Halanaerobium congolense]|uniref:hypothetical protein n=1 Tax=Halanaerobium congolense TaxID=54121 RepID=UPI000932EDBC|nr:hypothetical protein [Halanaerobium congolense]